MNDDHSLVLFCLFSSLTRVSGHLTRGCLGSVVGCAPSFGRVFLLFPSDQLSVKGNVLPHVSLAKSVSPQFNSFLQILP